MSTPISLAALKKISNAFLVALLFVGALAACLLLFAQAQPLAHARQIGQSQSGAQRTFATPEDAVHALAVAAEAKDRAALGGVFGPDYSQLLSGDRVEDRTNLAKFAEAMQQASQLQKDSDDKYTLLVGADKWPMPIPIVQRDGRWLFDTKAGLDEVLNRRIGENELSAIATCRAYVLAQWEYFTSGDHDNDGVAEYAQKFMSSPGQHDGLYWETAEGQPPSPLGSLVAEARAEGYGPRTGARGASTKSRSASSQSPQTPRHPFHGYFFKILTAQGPHAPGGKYNFIINGNMIAGYALIAYPNKWGNSGVMTFIVNQQGRVYQKNLGPDTLRIAGAIAAYDPDPSWQLVHTAE
jgi:Protein of unknown function (DUF2950)